MSNGHRWMKFWPQDWQGDDALRQCSLPARALWLELLCIAHKAVPRGSVLIGGRPPTAKRIAIVADCTEREVVKYLDELETEGVLNRDPDGTIYSSKMRSDEEASEAGREHISKRWNGAKPTDPPIRGAIRVATRKPNGSAISHPTSPPITTEADTDSEAEAEKKRKKISPLPSNLTVGSRAREETPPADALRTLLDEAGEPPHHHMRPLKPATDSVGSGPVAAQVSRVAKALATSVPYGTVRSPDEQIAKLGPQSEVVDTGGYRWQPCDPVRTVEEQLAILRGVA
jgi:hypothetical protein